MSHLYGSAACRRLAIVLAVFLAVVVSISGTASAAPADSPLGDPVRSMVSAAPIGTAGIASASLGPRTRVLGPKATKRIVGALSALGVGGAITMCGFLVPADIKPYCGLIISALAALGPIGDVGDKCLSVTVTFGVPPVRVSLVPCPVTPQPELVPDAPVIPQLLPVVI